MKPSVIEFRKFFDDRGAVYGALVDLDKLGIKRTYVIKNWSRGMVRAWHGHMVGHTYMHVIKGAAKLAAVNMNEYLQDSTVVVLTEENPGVLHVPPGYYNGAMALEDDTRLLVYSTISLEEAKKDDHRADHYLYGGYEIWKVVNR